MIIGKYMRVLRKKIRKIRHQQRPSRLVQKTCASRNKGSLDD